MYCTILVAGFYKGLNSILMTYRTRDVRITITVVHLRRKVFDSYAFPFAQDKIQIAIRYKYDDIVDNGTQVQYSYSSTRARATCC
jgi:hypothetical protein